MKNLITVGKAFRRGFTLIELLVVIAIIALLASLLLVVNAAATRSKLLARTRTELSQIVTAIETYKAKLGSYPRDNPTNPAVNQLYFELLGTTNDGNFYTTLDGSAKIQVSSVSSPAPNGFGPAVDGFVNSSKGGSGDEARPALKLLIPKPSQIGELSPGVKILIGSVPWPQSTSPQIPGYPTFAPWCYNSSSPTNNPNTYDLWIDLLISGKTNRISNWSAH